MSEPDSVESTVLSATIAVFRYNKELADGAVVQLGDEPLHQPLDPNTNSIAVIMKHVAGNLLSRWTDFLTTDGEKPWRDRDQEFVDTFTSRKEVLEYWERGWSCLFQTLDGLSPDDLTKTITIRGEPHTVPLAISRSLSHTGYHVGQIVVIARILAKDNWQTLTIPRGDSASYNQRMWDKSPYLQSE